MKSQQLTITKNRLFYLKTLKRLSVLSHEPWACICISQTWQCSSPGTISGCSQGIKLGCNYFLYPAMEIWDGEMIMVWSEQRFIMKWTGRSLLEELALATKVRGPWQINNVTCHQVLNNILHPANNILSSNINPMRNKSPGNKIISFYFLPLPDSASIWTKYTSWSFISDLA